MHELLVEYREESFFPFCPYLEDPFWGGGFRIHSALLSPCISVKIIWAQPNIGPPLPPYFLQKSSAPEPFPPQCHTNLCFPLLPDRRRFRDVPACLHLFPCTHPIETVPHSLPFLPQRCFPKTGIFFFFPPNHQAFPCAGFA